LRLGVIADRDPRRDRQAAEEVADSVERLLERRLQAFVECLA
jgi:hypothetical protein